MTRITNAVRCEDYALVLTRQRAGNYLTLEPHTDPYKTRLHCSELTKHAKKDLHRAGGTTECASAQAAGAGDLPHVKAAQLSRQLLDILATPPKVQL